MFSFTGNPRRLTPIFRAVQRVNKNHMIWVVRDKALYIHGQCPSHLALFDCRLEPDALEVGKGGPGPVCVPTDMIKKAFKMLDQKLPVQVVVSGDTLRVTQRNDEKKKTKEFRIKLIGSKNLNVLDTDLLLQRYHHEIEFKPRELKQMFREFREYGVETVQFTMHRTLNVYGLNDNDERYHMAMDLPKPVYPPFSVQSELKPLLEWASIFWNAQKCVLRLNETDAIVLEHRFQETRIRYFLSPKAAADDDSE